jgi:hypothetical protein
MEQINNVTSYDLHVIGIQELKPGVGVLLNWNLFGYDVPLNALWNNTAQSFS